MHQPRPVSFSEAAKRAVRRRLGTDLKLTDQVFMSDFRIEMIAALAGGPRTLAEVGKLTNYVQSYIDDEFEDMDRVGIVRSFGLERTYALHPKHPAYEEIRAMAHAVATELGYVFPKTDPASRAKGKRLYGTASRVYREVDPVVSYDLMTKMHEDPRFKARYTGYSIFALMSVSERRPDGSVTEDYVYETEPQELITDDMPWREQLVLRVSKSPSREELRDAEPAETNVVPLRREPVA